MGHAPELRADHAAAHPRHRRQRRRLRPRHVVQNLAWGFLQPVAGALAVRARLPAGDGGAAASSTWRACCCSRRREGMLGVMLGAGVLIGWRSPAPPRPLRSPSARAPCPARCAAWCWARSPRRARWARCLSAPLGQIADRRLTAGAPACWASLVLALVHAAGRLDRRPGRSRCRCRRARPSASATSPRKAASGARLRQRAPSW